MLFGATKLCQFVMHQKNSCCWVDITTIKIAKNHLTMFFFESRLTSNILIMLASAMAYL